MQGTVSSRTGVFLAYAIAAFTTLLWFGCVLPAGPLASGRMGDWATPMRREAWLLVPGMLLLVITPVGVLLAQGRTGLRAVLAATDAFVSLYAAAALAGKGLVHGIVPLVLDLLLWALAGLSLVETRRQLRRRNRRALWAHATGLRLAISLLALLTPAWLLVRNGIEVASLLGPFVLVALGAGGAKVATSARGLRFTAALVQLVVAAHLFVTLRYTLYDATPRLRAVGDVGRATLGLAALVLALTLAQALRLLWRVGHVRPANGATDVALEAPGA
jgi:hypothetical protein